MPVTNGPKAAAPQEKRPVTRWKLKMWFMDKGLMYVGVTLGILGIAGLAVAFVLAK